MVLGVASWWGFSMARGWRYRRRVRRHLGGLSAGRRSRSTTSSRLRHHLAPGVARFMSTLFFVDQQGSCTNSSIAGKMGSFTMPFLSGGPFFSRDSTTNPLRDLEKRGWFMVSDVAGLLRGLTTGVRYDIVLGIVLFVLSTYVLWHTRFGLRLRSAGERPSAADSLGVRVLMYRYIGVAISGGLAGFGGAMLALAARRYSRGRLPARLPRPRRWWSQQLEAARHRLVRCCSAASTASRCGSKPGNLVIALMLAAAIVLASRWPTKLAHDGFAPRASSGPRSGRRHCHFPTGVQTQLGENVGLFLLMMVGGLAIATVAIIRREPRTRWA